MDRLWDIYRQADTAFERALRFTYENDYRAEQYHETALMLHLAAKAWAQDALATAKEQGGNLYDRYELVCRICNHHVTLHTNRIAPPVL